MLVSLAAAGDNRACFCCALECNGELTFSVEYCGMTVEDSVSIPGLINIEERPPVEPGQPEKYLFVAVTISCSACGWDVAIGICARCGNTEIGEAWVATIPFAEAEETPGAGHCPESGEVALECFGEQFGIPCSATVTASIS